MNNQIRMLSAIMFSDMVGYTALMQNDEKKAKELRDRYRKVLEENIAKHQGKIIQYYGDGSLSIFGSAIQSALCAEKCFKKALELNTGAAYLHYNYSIYLRAIGNIQECVEESEKALSLDPLSLVINNNLGENYVFAERYREAKDQFLKTLELDSNFRGALWSLGYNYIYMNDYEKALETFLIAQSRTKGDSIGLKGQAPLGVIYALMNKYDEVDNCLKILKEREVKDLGVSFTFDYVIIYKALKDYDKVFYYLEKAFEGRNGGILFIGKHPAWRDIQTDPRFKSLMKKVGLES